MIYGIKEMHLMQSFAHELQFRADWCVLHLPDDISAVQELQRGMDYKGTMQLLVLHRQYGLAEMWAATRPCGEQVRGSLLCVLQPSRACMQQTSHQEADGVFFGGFAKWRAVWRARLLANEFFWAPVRHECLLNGEGRNGHFESSWQGLDRCKPAAAAVMASITHGRAFIIWQCCRESLLLCGRTLDNIAVLEIITILCLDDLPNSLIQARLGVQVLSKL